MANPSISCFWFCAKCSAHVIWPTCIITWQVRNYHFHFMNETQREKLERFSPSLSDSRVYVLTIWLHHNKKSPSWVVCSRTDIYQGVISQYFLCCWLMAWWNDCRNGWWIIRCCLRWSDLSRIPFFLASLSMWEEGVGKVTFAYSFISMRPWHFQFIQICGHNRDRIATCVLSLGFWMLNTDLSIGEKHL